jgi:hypothetical protein
MLGVLVHCTRFDGLLWAGVVQWEVRNGLSSGLYLLQYFTCLVSTSFYFLLSLLAPYPFSFYRYVPNSKRKT